MRELNLRQVAQRFRRQYGVAGRSQLRALGVSAHIEHSRVARGEWERPASRVIRLAGSSESAEQDLMIALLEVAPSAIASHQSAAWLWDLLPPPDRHAVTVAPSVRWRNGPFEVHRIGGTPPTVSFRRNIPSTSPLRTLVDLAAVVSPDVLDDATDRAVARQLVTVDAVRAELDRLGRKGRNGVGAMREALRRRGLREGPHPSVLEARLHRLLRSGGIIPMKVEVVAGPAGEYRLDVLLDPGVAVEVDGHSHHSTPAQKAYDERRRAEIRMGGTFLLVYDWSSVTHDGRRVLAECHLALARYGASRRADHHTPADGRLPMEDRPPARDWTAQ
jgi:very-short-patch-repair endonuclease